MVDIRSLLSDGEIPMGLGMALARNPEALQAFSALSPEGRSAVIERTHDVQSKREMEQLVRELGSSPDR